MFQFPIRSEQVRAELLGYELVLVSEPRGLKGTSRYSSAFSGGPR